MTEQSVQIRKRSLRIISLVVCLLLAPSKSFCSIQSDIDALGSAGGTVTIPAGITTVSQTITVPDNVTLEGSAANSVLKPAAGFNAAVIQNANTSTGNSGMRFIGFKIDGSVSSATGAGIRLISCSNIIFKDMQICSCSDGIEITGNSHDIIVRQCRLFSNGRIGIGPYSGNGIKMDGSSADLHNVLITGCTVYSNYYSGIHARFINNLRMYNNYVYDQGQHGSDAASGDDSIKLFQCNRIIAFANRLDKSKNNGIEFWGNWYYVAAANNITRSDDGKHGYNIGNGCALGHLAGSPYYGQAYVMLANMLIENVYTIMQETNYNTMGCPSGVITNNNMARNALHGLHHVSCKQTISAANIARDTGNYDYPEEGTEISGAILSGSETMNVHANLCFDSRSHVDQMYGIYLRATSDSLLSDNFIANAEMIALRIESNCSNITESSNIYHNPVIRFIVSSPTSPPLDDRTIKGVLEGYDYTVNYYDDNSSHPGAITEDLILISGTVVPSLIGAAYRNSAVPVLILSKDVMPNMELADSGGSVPSQTNIKVINTGNHTTSFLSTGSNYVASSIPFGYVTGNVIGIKLASINSDTNKSTIVAIEKNTLDQLGVAVPARRAFMFISSGTYTNLNDSGMTVFKRGVEWTLGAD
jgi:hypothetical protein